MHPVLAAPRIPLLAQRRLYVGIALLLAFAFAMVGVFGAKLRHLAVPVWAAAPTLPLAPVTPLAEDGSWTRTEVARVRGRVAALVRSPDGALWVGGFDSGLFRVHDGRVDAVGGLEGRERLVHALAVEQGRVFAGTSAGIVELSLRGQRRSVHLRGLATDALVHASSTDGRSELLAGTPRGLYRLSSHGVFEDVLARDPGGEGLRVSALSSTGGMVWMGTPSGVYSISLAAIAGPRDRRVARWLPLVFGTRAAQTNVVLALSADPGGALAGTDDGGLVRVPAHGEVRALRFADPRANQVNPGTACALGEQALFGTQGGGVLLVGPGPELTPRRIAPGEVSALLCEPGGVTAGMADGTVIRLEPRAANL